MWPRSEQPYQIFFSYLWNCESENLGAGMYILASLPDNYFVYQDCIPCRDLKL